MRYDIGLSLLLPPLITGTVVLGGSGLLRGGILLNHSPLDLVSDRPEQGTGVASDPFKGIFDLNPGAQ